MFLSLIIIYNPYDFVALDVLRAVADPEGGPWGPLTPPFEVNFKRLNDTS